MVTANLTVPITLNWKDIEGYMAQHDIVEVVRCKDCIWYDQEHQSTVFYNSFFCNLWQIFSKPDHFCESGIRKENK